MTCGGKHSGKPKGAKSAPAGYHFMPDGSLMKNSAHQATTKKPGGKPKQGRKKGR